jgi:endoglucanase
MKYLVCLLLLVLCYGQYCRASGKKILDPSGKELFLKGIGIGNWLNPEGYMVEFDKINQFRTMNEAFSELLNYQGAKDFWTQFRKYYMTDDDFKYIRKAGFNLVRLPFDYKLFIDEDNPGTYK